MLSNNKEILYSSPNIKIKTKQKGFSSNNYTQLPKVISVKDSLLLKTQLDKITNRDLNDKYLSLSIDKYTNNSNDDHNNNFIDSISSDKNENDSLKSFPKYRINSQVGHIRNKLYDSQDKNKLRTLILEKPNYYLNVLDKKRINDLKVYLYKDNIPYTQVFNHRSIINPKRKIKKSFDDLSIKELQKLYYDIDNITLPNVSSLNKNKEKVINNNRYKFENYASNKNIFNHPKLYFLDGNVKTNDRLLPKVKNRTNEISLQLEFENNKYKEKLRMQKLYADFVMKILKK